MKHLKQVELLTKKHQEQRKKCFKDNERFGVWSIGIGRDGVGGKRSTMKH